jgi:hypothetical protein
MNEAQRSFLFDEPDQLPKVKGSDWEIEPILREIESVARKTKSMSVFSISEDMIDHELYIQLLKKSIDMGVMASFHKRIDGINGNEWGEIFLFFVSREESWRIPAYLSMKRAFQDYDWSDGAEFLEGTLLGYSESQMISWINAKKRRRIGWLGLTCYFLVSHAQRNQMKKLASRCIDPSSVMEDIEVFRNMDNRPPKENVHELLPEGLNLCRASIKSDFCRKLFARDISSGRKASFFVSAINSGNANDLNESLQSNFEFFGG